MPAAIIVVAGISAGMSGCLPRPDVPQPLPAPQPQRHEQAWVGQIDGDSLLLERLDDDPATLWRVPAVGDPSPVMTGLSWPPGSREQWAVTLPSGALATRASREPPAMPDLALRVYDDAVLVVGPAGAAEQVFTFTQSPVELWWITDAEGRFLGLEARYDGSPQVRAVHRASAHEAAARLWFRLGYEAHVAGDYASALRDFTRSWEADPRPGRGDVLYNLACASARLQRPEAALRYLGEALAAQHERFAPLASTDPDLASLAAHEEFRRLMRLYSNGVRPAP